MFKLFAAVAAANRVRVAAYIRKHEKMRAKNVLVNKFAATLLRLNTRTLSNMQTAIAPLTSFVEISNTQTFRCVISNVAK